MGRHYFFLSRHGYSQLQETYYAVCTGAKLQKARDEFKPTLEKEITKEYYDLYVKEGCTKIV